MWTDRKKWVWHESSAGQFLTRLAFCAWFRSPGVDFGSLFQKSLSSVRFFWPTIAPLRCIFGELHPIEKGDKKKCSPSRWFGAPLRGALWRIEWERSTYYSCLSNGFRQVFLATTNTITVDMKTSNVSLDHCHSWKQKTFASIQTHQLLQSLNRPNYLLLAGSTIQRRLLVLSRVISVLILLTAVCGSSPINAVLYHPSHTDLLIKHVGTKCFSV